MRRIRWGLLLALVGGALCDTAAADGDQPQPTTVGLYQPSLVAGSLYLGESVFHQNNGSTSDGAVYAATATVFSTDEGYCYGEDTANAGLHLASARVAAHSSPATDLRFANDAVLNGRVTDVSAGMSICWRHGNYLSFDVGTAVHDDTQGGPTVDWYYRAGGYFSSFFGVGNVRTEFNITGARLEDNPTSNWGYSGYVGMRNESAFHLDWGLGVSTGYYAGEWTPAISVDATYKICRVWIYGKLENGIWNSYGTRAEVGVRIPIEF
jgi:hypothetical protein